MLRKRTETGSVIGDLLSLMCIIILLPVLIIALIGFAACLKVATDPIYDSVPAIEEPVRSD